MAAWRVVEQASICANLEALTAQVYLAVVIARLVGIRATQPASAQDTGTRW
jgi:hypothetical protein